MENQKNKEVVREAIKRIAGTFDKPITQILFAVVDSVDVSKRTCKVVPISGDSNTPIEDVSLSIDQNDGEIKIPTTGSTVGVAISNQIDAFVFAWSDLEEIILKGGNFFGLVKVKELTQKLNALENKVNEIRSQFNSHTHSGVTTGGGVSAVPAVTISGSLSVTQQADIENKTIKHGNK